MEEWHCRGGHEIPTGHAPKRAVETRIRSHVLLCWLALLLVRLAENATGETWRNLRTEIDKLHLGRFVGPAGEVSQRTETTTRQAAISRPQVSPSRPATSGWPRRRLHQPLPADLSRPHAPRVS
jgi:hypothetical protein